MIENSKQHIPASEISGFLGFLKAAGSDLNPNYFTGKSEEKVNWSGILGKDVGSRKWERKTENNVTAIVDFLFLRGGKFLKPSICLLSLQQTMFPLEEHNTK